MPSIEFWILGVATTIIGGLLKLAWHLHSKKIDEIAAHVGVHFSKINDLRQDHTALEGRVNAHDDKLTDVVGSISVFRDETNKALGRIEDKLDKFRERGQQ